MSSPVKPVDARTEIVALVQKQAADWNVGDLKAFMKAYVPSEAVTYVSSAGEVRGYANLLKRYENKYGTDQSAMGKLGFGQIEVTQLGETSALCVLKWNLMRTDKPEMNGIATLVLTRGSTGGWLILHDHTSVLDAAKN